MIKIERLTKKESEEEMKSWIHSSFSVPTLNNKDYIEVRNDLVTCFNESKAAVNGDIKSYEMDVQFGAHIYEYFRSRSWFTDRLASDDGFWRYLSLKVVPDLVGARWGNDNSDHYYTKPSRIWFKTLWWYYFLSLKSSDIEATKEMLLSNKFSTDTVLNLVERTGRSGTNVEVYRSIMAKYASLNKSIDKDFRRVMKLNTAKAVVLEPEFCIGGITGYVESIYQELSLV